MRSAEPTYGSDAGAGEADDLGPVVLEQRPKPQAADLFLVLAALFLIPTALTPFMADFRTGVFLGPLLAFGGCLFGIFGILYVLTNAGKASYLHERGLRLRNGKGWRVVRYPDVTEMTFRATRMYYNGAYTGTLQEIGVKTDETEGQPLVFKHSYRERSGLQTGYRDVTPLNHLCDLLTVQISRRMAERIERGESVAWTPAMRISGRGVEVVNRAGAADEVDWDRIARVDVERGIFRLWVEGVDKPRVQVPVGLPNFFPGYALVLPRLQGQPAAPATPAPAIQAAPSSAAPALSEGMDSIRIEYTPTVNDSAALRRWYYRATPAGRKAWAVRVWSLPMVVLGVGLMIGLINIFNKDMPEMDAVAAAILVVGLLLRPLLGWLIPALDRARLVRELRAAQQAAREGRGADPFGRREVLLAPEGYAIRTPHGQGRHGWSEVSRIEWSEGYVFVFLAADRVRRETVGLTLPPRAFHGRWAAEEACERIRVWQEAAPGPGPS